jgi:hypothetical protein
LGRTWLLPPPKKSGFGRRIEKRRSVKGALTSDAVGTLNWKRDGDGVASVAFRVDEAALILRITITVLRSLRP